jgi:hypothetical protein
MTASSSYELLAFSLKTTSLKQYQWPIYPCNFRCNARRATSFQHYRCRRATLSPGLQVCPRPFHCDRTDRWSYHRRNLTVRHALSNKSLDLPVLVISAWCGHRVAEALSQLDVGVASMSCVAIVKTTAALTRVLWTSVPLCADAISEPQMVAYLPRRRPGSKNCAQKSPLLS